MKRGLRRRATTSNLAADTRSPKTIRLRFSLSLSLHRTPIIVPLSSDLVSPVPHLLASNLPPSDAERIIVQDAIDIVSAQNDAIIATSKALGSQKLDPAVTRRLEAGLEFVQAHRNVLSSVRLLPPELIAEIICIYSDSFLLHSHPHIITLAKNGVIYPWALSQVSRLWRSTALSLHHLWGQLIVDTCLWKSNQPSTSFLGLFANLVDRSQNAPLCIYFCTPRDVQVDELRPIIDILTSHSDRWDTVYLVSTYSVIKAFEGVRRRLSSLRRLYLSFTGEDPIADQEPIGMFEVAPRLTSLYLGTSLFVGKVLLPWSQFTVFLDGGDSSNGFVREKIVPASQSLVELQLTRLPNEELCRKWPEVQLDNLRLLLINFYSNEEEEPQDAITDNFLRSLKVPSIEEIRITNYPGNIIPPLTSLIYHSLQCTSLQELAISTYYLGEFQPGELASFLELTPSLRRLSIYLPSVLDLHRLVLNSDTPQPLLPNLEELFIFVYDSISGYEEVLAQLAVSRCEQRTSTAPSQTCHFSQATNRTIYSESTFEDVRRFQHMRIIFPAAVLCHSGHEVIECCHSGTANDLSPLAMDRVTTLKNWTPLANSLPSIFSYFWSPSPKLGMKIKRALQVSQFFSNIENVRVESVQELYLSDIHHLMYHVSNLSSSEVPGDNLYHFRRRAKALLDKWAPFLLNDLHNRRWAFQGGHSIVYVPKDGGKSHPQH
ncbi:hypothetical protein CPC08DRAFT_39923 [Agrocybe pediades]|nr:hypothetical protein CPC08DRAFT_39923 [Agrocybe pediades]